MKNKSSGTYYHGGPPDLPAGTKLRAPAHVTTSLGIACFYAASVPDGWVYEVECIKATQDPKFARSVPCFIGKNAVVGAVVRRMLLSDVEVLALPAAIRATGQKVRRRSGQ